MDQIAPHARPSRRFAAKARPRLVLGGIAAAAGLSLGGCDGTPDFQTAEFTSVAACSAAGFPDNLCQASYNAAYLEHARTAPQFKSSGDCEKEWGSGQCASQFAGASSGLAVAPTSGSIGNVFVPALAGFLVSQQLQKRFYDTGEIDIDYYGGYGGGYRGSPVYRNRTGGTVTVDRSSGRAVATPVNVNTRTAAQSGFGGRSFSRSSSGSGHSSFGG
jgi:uncharacterized protein YgiB involved in biofilm formation